MNTSYGVLGEGGHMPKLEGIEVRCVAGGQE
jgi:hypothetical protein